MDDSDEKIGELNRRIAEHYQRDELSEAISLLGEVLTIQRATVGENHPDYAQNLNNLGALFAMNGDNEQALQSYLDALAIRRTALGDDHPDVLQTVVHLVTLFSRPADHYTQTGDYAAAEQLYIEALTIQNEVLGDHHPDCAYTLNNLGYLYETMGNNEAAEQCYRQVIEIRRSICGENHPDYADSLNNLGILFESMGNYEAAEPLWRDALLITQATLGEEHESTVTIANNMARLYSEMGNYEAAEPLLRRVLESRRATVGETDPGFVTSLKNLADMYCNADDSSSAVPLYRQVVEITRSTLGEDNADYATHVNDLAAVLVAAGDFAAAEPLFQEALKIRRTVLGEDHPHVAQSLSNLSALYFRTGRYVEAEPLMRRSLEVRRSGLGEDDPSVNDSLANLLRLYDAMSPSSLALEPREAVAGADDRLRFIVRQVGAPVISAVALRPDSKLLAFGSTDSLVRLWSLDDDQGVSLLAKLDGSVNSLAFDSSGRFLAGGCDDSTVFLWDVDQIAAASGPSGGASAKTLTGHTGPVTHLIFSPDGKLLASASADQTIRLWDSFTCQGLHVLSSECESNRLLIFSEDSGSLTAISQKGEIRIWDLVKGEVFADIRTKSGCAVFDSDGRLVAAGSESAGIIVLDVESDETRFRITADTIESNAVILTSAGRRVVTGDRAGRVKLRDAVTGELLSDLPCHRGSISAVAFSPDDRLLVCGGTDGTLFVWDAGTKQEVASLTAIGERDWAVTEPGGRFAASPDALPSLHLTLDWVVDVDLMRFKELRESCFEPRLIAKLLGFTDEPFHTEVSPSTAAVYPDVEFVDGEPKEPVFRLRVTNRGGGIGRVAVSLNGKEVMLDARSRELNAQEQHLDVDVDLSNHPDFEAGTENTIEVKAFNAEEYLAGRGWTWIYGNEVTEPDTYKPQIVAETGPSHQVECVAFSPDGKLLANSNKDMNIELRHEATGEQLRILRGHDAIVTSLAFSPNGRTLASGSEDGEVRLWNIINGRLIHPFTRLPGRIVAITHRPDKGLLIAGSDDGTIVIWDVNTGTELRAYRTCSDLPDVSRERRVSTNRAVTFSPDAKLAAIAHPYGLIRVWDLESGRNLLSFEAGSESSLHCPAIVAFDPARKTLAIGYALPEMVALMFNHLDSSEFSVSPNLMIREINLFDVSSGTQLRSLSGHKNGVRALAYGPNGKHLASADSDGTIKIWDAEAGTDTHTIQSDFGLVSHLAFSPDGLNLMAGEGKEHFQGRISFWDVKSGERLRTFERHIGDINPVVFSPDGRTFVMGGEDKTISLWSIDRTGGPRLFKGHNNRVFSLAFSPDGDLLASGSWDGTTRIWNPRTGDQLFELHYAAVWSIAFSLDGKLLASACADGTVRLWNVAESKPDRPFGEEEAAHQPPLVSGMISVAFSPDGKLLASGDADGTIHLWDIQTGEKLQTLQGHTEYVSNISFSPDGKILATGGYDQIVRLWDVATATPLNTAIRHLVPRHIEKGASIAFRADGEILATGGTYGVVKLWETATRQEISTFTGHSGSVASVKFSSDGAFLAAGSNDATATIWNVRSPDKPEKLCSLYSFPDGSWAVIDAEGRFDASDGGDIQWMHWVIGVEPVALSQLKERYYEPGLLSKLFGYGDEPLRDVPALAEVRLYPEIELVTTGRAGANPLLRFNNRGGGIGRIALSINGKEVTADARGKEFDNSAARQELEIDLSNHPFMIPGTENACEVRAYNAEGYLVSRNLRWVCAAPQEELEPPQLWAILAGISDYQGDELDLRLAAKDAEDMTTTVRLGAERLFSEKTHIYLLTAHLRSSVDGRVEPARAGMREKRVRPTRANLANVFEEVAKSAKSTDILLVYMAGHGVNYGGQDGDYYYLTADARTGNLEDPAVRHQTAISSFELTEWIQKIASLKQVLILDTCAAGRLVDKLSENRQIPSSQTRALDRMKDRMGLHIVAGSTADAVSYESSRYGQGLLTYSLLLGMQGAALRDDEFVDISRLFEFAADTVPRLAADIGGIQRPITATPRGGASFDIGRLSEGDRKQIPLARIRPLILRANLEDEKIPVDHLGLTKPVNDLFREHSARVPEAPLIYIDVGEHPGAYQLKGRYRLEGDMVSLNLWILYDLASIVTIEIKAKASELGNLVQSIAAKVEEAVKFHFEAVS